MKKWWMLFLFMVSQVLWANLPVPIHWQTSHGMDVYFLHSNELPIVDIQAVVRSGSAEDGKNPGLALLTASVLTQGAKGWKEKDWRQLSLESGVILETEVLPDFTLLHLRSLSEPSALASGLKLWRASLVRPAFSKKLVDWQREKQALSLKQSMQSPQFLVDQRMDQYLYAKHGYAHPPLGTTRSIPKLSAQKVKDFYRAHYHRANIFFTIVGDISQERALHLLESIDQALNVGSTQPLSVLTSDPPAPRLFKIPMPIAQIHMQWGQWAVSRKAKDFLPLYGSEYVFGGGMSSRLFDAVREKKGLAYDVHSFVETGLSGGSARIGLQTRASAAVQALDTLHETWVEYRTQGPSAKELQEMKAQLLGEQYRRLASNEGLSHLLLKIGLYHWSLDHLSRAKARIEGLEAKELHRTFAHYVNPDTASLVVVGPVAALNQIQHWWDHSHATK